jgi:hypothetical protein
VILAMFLFHLKVPFPEGEGTVRSLDQSGKESGSGSTLETLPFSKAESKVCNMLEYYSLLVQMNSFAMFFSHPEQLKYVRQQQYNKI